MGDLEEECEAIDAIFPGCIENLAEGIFALIIPDHEEVSIQMAFPELYPEAKPSIVQVFVKSSRFLDPLYLERNVAEILDRVFVQGDVVLFELIGELQQFLDDYKQEHVEIEKEQEAEKQRQLLEKMKNVALSNQDSDNQLRNLSGIEGMNFSGNLIEIFQSNKVDESSNLDYTAGWVRSDPITDRGSTFLAFAREVHSVEKAREYLATLTCDRKIAKAAHNMNSWRIRGKNDVAYQDCDDDGETAAGLRMLHLLTIMDVWNVIVVVSRWFGGTHLGPDRFKHINSATRDVIIKAGFYVEKKKGK